MIALCAASPAVHVERRVGLRVARGLRLGERLGEAQPALGHAREDVVARAVDDAVDRLDVIADEGLADRLDDRDAARRPPPRKRPAPCACVAASKISCPCSASSALLPVTTIFLALDRAEDELAGSRPSAPSARRRSGSPDRRADPASASSAVPPARRRRALARHRARRFFCTVELVAEPLPEQGTILRQVLEDTCADVAHSCESDGRKSACAKGRGLSRAAEWRRKRI